MTATNSAESRPPLLILCGPQAQLPPPGDVRRIHQVLVRDGMAERLLPTVKDFPNVFQRLASRDEKLSRVPGLDKLDCLRHWLDSGDLGISTETLPSIIALPLTAILQIGQFLQYLHEDGGDTWYQSVLEGGRHYDVQGFCAGFLTAAAIAFSGSTQDLGDMVAISIRLAMCIGAYVDCDSMYADPPDLACTLSVRWSKEDLTRDDVDTISNRYPGTYVSCITDDTCATVTTSANFRAELAMSFRKASFRVKPVSITARYHCPAVYSTAVEHLDAFCRATDGFQFPDPARLKVSLRRNATGQPIGHGDEVFKVALESILLHASDWYGTVKASLDDFPTENPTTVVLGCEEGIIPFSLARRISNGHAKSTPPMAKAANGTNGVPQSSGTVRDLNGQYPPRSIAVVGMACRFPGADSIERFWELLASGVSTVQKPPTRLILNSKRIADRPETQFWGNFIDDPDAFDHRFFKKTTREAVSWDPELRVLLEVAYEALESAGFFGSGSGSRSVPTDYGCYLGAVANNYYDNVVCHPPTAYSMLGTSRAFFSGRISHQFGLTGPAMTVDTACSSSLVAINAACRAIQSGECTRALAGGTNIFTSPFDYQNLAAAGFLSPTGACKPFDASADGYCRGEGVGVVVLKSLSAALEEHDNVLGVIVGSSVNQNLNDAHITVPCSTSQTRVYSNVLHMANAAPSQVSYVEAHGTGTQIGDPIECQSIREGFSGPDRKETLYFGSVKGHIGHTEASSGVAGLIKVLLMMQKCSILGQANFNSLNPKIPALEPDKMEIPQKSLSWQGSSRLACINSYGAAGSNAAVAVRQAPPKLTGDTKRTPVVISKQPLILSAASRKSLSMYSRKLLEFIRSERATCTDSRFLLSSLLFNLADRVNQALPYTLIETVTDLDDLEKKLEETARNPESVPDATSPNPPSVIMVFGGQESDYVGLSEELFRNAAILRFHLDQCETYLRLLGQRSLYPAIFQRSTISHVPTLHASLFAIQYSSAKCWIDCGLDIKAVVGHSFGQLTALCICGCLSLSDALILVVRRAELITSSWGAERGSMISLQADFETTSSILASLNADGENQDKLEIACFNHPLNHVIVGSEKAVSSLDDFVANDPKLNQSVLAKRLKVTHGFHSAFTDPLLPDLYGLASSIRWEKPKVHIELSTEGSTNTDPGPWLIPEHTRKPVFFKEAIGRLTERFGDCTWLEAGQRTSVISLVQNCMGSKSASPQRYRPSVLSSPEVMNALAELTVALCKTGYALRFWPFHRLQRHQYDHKNVPPYQFEKTKHWLPFVDRVEEKPAVESDTFAQPRLIHEFFSFIGFQDESKKVAVFLVDPQSERYKMLLKGHITSRQALAPVSLYIELLSRTAMALVPSATYETHVTSIKSLQMRSPIGLDENKDIFFTLSCVGDEQLLWSFVVSSRTKDGRTNDAIHTTGQVGLKRRGDPALGQKMKRYGSLIGFNRCLSILNATDGEKMQGKHIYQAIQRLVHFDEMYQGIKSISCMGHEAAGRVVAKVNPRLDSSENLYDTPVIDSLMQFAGILVNYFCHPSTEEVLVCLGIKQIVTSSSFDIHAGDWLAYALLTEDTDQRTECDVYIFDAKEERVAIAFLGFEFTRTSMSVPAQALQSANNTGISNSVDAPKDDSGASTPAQSQFTPPEPVSDRSQPLEPRAGSKRQELREILHRVTDIPPDEISDDSTLEDLGIDSLVVMELLNDLQASFGIEIDLNKILFFPNVRAICTHIDSVLGIGSDRTGPDEANLATVQGSGEAKNIQPPGESTQSLPGTIRPHEAFVESKFEYDRFAVETKAAGFWEHAYPRQASLVLAYVVEGFAVLGRDMAQLKANDVVPSISHLPRHKQLVRQLFRVLEDAKLIKCNDQGEFIRTSKPVDPTPASSIFTQILVEYPQHANVYKLVQVIGSELALCLTGAKDGLQLVFGDKANKQNLDDVYENWPLVRSATLALGEFLARALSRPKTPGKFSILEVGAGTGGTTKYIVEHLQKLGIPFRYVFTDLSASLVAQAKRTFKNVPNMEFSVLDIETEPKPSWLNSFHVIISTNCIHATRNLTRSLTMLRRLLRDDGVLTLVEITHNMFWLDIAVGLFEGWWLFEDGREHAVTSEDRWQRCMMEAGFKEVDWTDGELPEARTIRVIAGFASAKA